MDDRIAKNKFLDDKVFYGLSNLNNGCDSPSIKYFSSKDFELVLDRVEKLNIGIYGIEPWYNGEFYDVVTCEEFGKDPTDASWYGLAFNQFKSTNLDLQYAASYYIPNLEKKENQK